MTTKSKRKQKGQKKEKQKEAQQVAATISEKTEEHPDLVAYGPGGDDYGRGVPVVKLPVEEDMPEEKTVVLKPVTPEAGQGGQPAPNPVPQSSDPDEWLISVTMKNRQNAILHISGLMNLIVSLEVVGESATKDPDIAKNEMAKDIFAHNINEAQTLAMLHVTQLVVQHQISWNEVLESMISEYMKNMPEAERVAREGEVRQQAYGVVSTGYQIIDRCRKEAIARAGGSGAVESKPA